MLTGAATLALACDDPIRPADGGGQGSQGGLDVVQGEDAPSNSGGSKNDQDPDSMPNGGAGGEGGTVPAPVPIYGGPFPDMMRAKV